MKSAIAKKRAGVKPAVPERSLATYVKRIAQSMLGKEGDKNVSMEGNAVVLTAQLARHVERRLLAAGLSILSKNKSKTLGEGHVLAASEAVLPAGLSSYAREAVQTVFAAHAANALVTA